MADNSRIPRDIDSFYPYIVNTTAYLKLGEPITNAVRLGILPTESDQWFAINDDWVVLYPLYSDKKNSRTTVIKDQILSLVAQCLALDQSCRILDRIAASPNVTIADVEMFNIKKGIMQKTTRTVSTTPISEIVSAIIQPLGGGSMSIKCRNSVSKGGIQERADGVQYLFMVGDTSPTSAEAVGMSKEFTTKASFVLALGAACAGQKLYIYFRWYNTRHPELAGVWSPLQTSFIL